LCTAHLERETKYLEERYKAAWPVKFRAMLRQANKLKKQLIPSDYYYSNHIRDLLEKELDNCKLPEGMAVFGWSILMALNIAISNIWGIS
jgi:hypothetical protein